MGRRIKFIVAIFLIALLLSIINRGVFVIFNYTLIAPECSAWELLQSFIHALILDASIAGYITAIPLIATIIAIWLPVTQRNAKAWRWALLGYFATITLAVAIIETGDIGLYGAWQSRIDAQVLIYSPKEMMASLTLGNILGAVAYIGATLAAALYLFDIAIRRWLLPEPSCVRHTILQRGIHTTLMILLAGVIFLIMRGGITTSTANVSMVHFSHKAILNKIAINPVFSLIESATTGDDLNRFDYYGEETAERIFLHSLHNADSKSDICGAKWLNTERPNIVIVVMEGMGCTITESYDGTEPVTPHLNALRSEGIWFENMYASSFRTDRGNVAILSGFPGQPTLSIMKLANKAAKLPGIASALDAAGYTTRFFYGGDSNFTNTRAYLYSTGYKEVVDEKSMNLEGHYSKWGYADNIVLDYAAEEIIRRIESNDTPSFETILTLSSHEPYEVPYSRLENKLLNSFAFTDEAIGNFIDRLRNSSAWEDMLIILVPDHSTPYPATIGNHTSERHRIPMIWLGGAVKEPMVVEEYMSQTDIAATLLGQMNVDHTEFKFSRDICAAGCAHFAYWAYPVGFGIIDSRGKTIYDCNTDLIITSEGDDTARHVEEGKAWLEKTFIEIRNM